jgi:hypothetical protein
MNGKAQEAGKGICRTAKRSLRHLVAHGFCFICGHNVRFWLVFSYAAWFVPCNANQWSSSICNRICRLSDDGCQGLFQEFVDLRLKICNNFMTHSKCKGWLSRSHRWINNKLCTEHKCKRSRSSCINSVDKMLLPNRKASWLPNKYESTT